MAVEAYHSRIGSALANRDYAEAEAAWREYASLHPEEHVYLLHIAAQMARHDKSALAGELCLALSQVLLDRGEMGGPALTAVRASLKANQRTEGLREMLILVYSAHHAGNPHLPEFIEKSGLGGDGGSLRPQVDALDRYLTFEEGAYVFHAGGWGYGIVAEFDADAEQMVVDFEHRKGHRISLLSATKILQRLPEDHIGVYKHFRRGELEELIKTDPSRVFRIFLHSHTRKLTLKQVREALVPSVLDKAEWTRWWGKAKRALLKDPNVRVGKGSSPLLELRDRAKPIEQEVVEKMQARKSGLEKAAVAREYLRTLDLTPELARAVGDEVDAALETESDPGGTSSRLALQYLRAGLKGSGAAAAIEEARAILAEATTADGRVALIQPLELADRKHAIQDLIEIGGPQWAESLIGLLRAGDSDVADTILDQLRQKRPDLLISCFVELKGDPRQNPALFLWYARGVVNDTIPKELAPGENKTHVMEKLLTLVNAVGLEQRRGGDPELKEFLRQVRSFMTSRRLRTFGAFVDSASADYARFLYSKIQLNKGFTDQTKHSLLDVIEEHHPNLQEEVQAERDQVHIREDVVYTTLRGYHRKDAELRNLIQVEIPENAVELGRAASFGDISENAEYSAALEKQEQLMKRNQSLRESLERARILDPDDVTTDKVVIGTRVTLKNLDKGTEESYSILGPWDSDLEQGIISYLSPVGRGLLGKPQGERTSIDLPDGSVDYEIVRIEAAPALMAE